MTRWVNYNTWRCWWETKSPALAWFRSGHHSQDFVERSEKSPEIQTRKWPWSHQASRRKLIPESWNDWWIHWYIWSGMLSITVSSGRPIESRRVNLPSELFTSTQLIAGIRSSSRWKTMEQGWIWRKYGPKPARSDSHNHIRYKRCRIRTSCSWFSCLGFPRPTR